MHEVAVFREVEVALERPWRQRLSPFLRYRTIFLLQFLLFLFCLIPLQVFAVRFLTEQLILREQIGSPSFSLSLLARATDTQIISFRDALVHLPYVRGVTHRTREQTYEEEAKLHPDVAAFLGERNLANPFTDTITVQLQSLQDLPAFREFLKRSELQSVLEPTVHARIRAAEDEGEAQVRTRYSAIQFLFAVVFLSVLLFLLLSLLTALLRLQIEKAKVILQSLAGTAPAKITRLFLLESLTLLGAALLVASVLVSSLVFSFPTLFLSGISTHLLATVRSSLFSVGVPVVLLEFLLLSSVSAAAISVAVRMVVGREEVVV